MSVKMRQEVERKIATAFVEAAVKAGYRITVDYGDGPSNIHWNAEAVLEEMFQGDDDYLTLFKRGNQVAWIHFVYGNDGWDVISDYSVNLEPLMAEPNKISKYYED